MVFSSLVLGGLIVPNFHTQQITELQTYGQSGQLVVLQGSADGNHPACFSLW
jgi:hypothetical protein